MNSILREALRVLIEISPVFGVKARKAALVGVHCRPCNGRLRRKKSVVSVSPLFARQGPYCTAKDCGIHYTFPFVIPPANRIPARVSLCHTGVAT
jgi:hypothetical protein